MGNSGIRKAYKTGRGLIKIRGVCEIEDHKIARDILHYSKRIIVYLILVIAVSFIFDWLFWMVYPSLRSIRFLSNSFSLLTRDSIQVGLEIFVGAISAVLGLIFALYNIGVQLASDRYSEKVSSFIIQEPVTDYFFTFLVFTDLYSLLILLKLHLVQGLPVVSFILASVFVAISLMGILVFKSHYVSSLKPLSLFQRIWRVCLDQFGLVTDHDSYKYKSWSLAVHGRDITNSHLNIFGDLFRDLVRNNNWNDASYAPVILGHILRDYIDIKKLIDKEKGWWFFEKYELVKADDYNYFPIKVNYELQGKGPLHIPKPAESWFEDKTLALLNEMSSYIQKDTSNKLVNRVVEGYTQFLVGKYEEQKGKRPKLIPGAIHDQEFQIFEKGLNSFLSIWQKIDFSKQNNIISLLNGYFVVSEGLIDEWDIDLALKIAESFYVDNQLNTERDFMYRKDIPTFTRDILINYWKRLEVEQTLENQLITPKERFIAEIKEVLIDKRQEIILSNLVKLFDSSDEIITALFKAKDYEYAGQFLKMQYEWISRFFSLNEVDLAELFSDRLRKNIGYFLYLPKSVVVDLEMLEQIEKGFFVSLIKRSKPLFNVYSNIIIILLIIIIDKEGDQNKLFKFFRLPLMWGGLVYLISELDQDFEYVTIFTKYLEKVFRPGAMVNLLTNISEFRPTTNIWWESTRYSPWYMKVLNEMRSKLQTVPYQDSGALSFTTKYEHSSSFIQKLGMWEFTGEERCIEGFVDWLKRREMIEKIINSLKSKKHE